MKRRHRSKKTQFALDGLIENRNVTSGTVVTFFLMALMLNALCFLGARTNVENHQIVDTFELDNDERLWSFSWTTARITPEEWEMMVEKDIQLGDAIPFIETCTSIRRAVYYSTEMTTYIFDDRVDSVQKGHTMEAVVQSAIQGDLEVSSGTGTDIIYADSNLVEFFCLKLSEGCNFTDNNKEIILGNAYEDELKLGDEITFSEESYKIVGFLDKNQKIPKDGIVEHNGMFDVRMMDLDYAVIINDRDSIHGGYAILDTDTSVSELGDELDEAAPWWLSVGSLFDMSNLLLQYANEYSAMITNLEKAVICMVVFSTMLCMITQLMMIEQRKKKYGILMANGYSKNDIAWMIFVEMFIKAIIPMIVSYCIVFAFAGKMAKDSWYNPWYLLNDYFLPFAILDVGMCVIYSAVLTIVPAVTVRKMSANEMMRI